MNKLTKSICWLLVCVLMLSLCACGKTGQDHSGDSSKTTVDTKPYVGTWRASDHDEENVVHYLIFDEMGYWNVYMNYSSLLRAIKQLPGQLVSFKKFCELQKSKHTGCYYEYVEDMEFAEDFTIDATGKMTAAALEGIFFTKISTHSGEPDTHIVSQARDLFDRALVEAHSK